MRLCAYLFMLHITSLHRAARIQTESIWKINKTY